MNTAQTNILELDQVSKTFNIKTSFGQKRSFYAVKELSLSLKKGSCLGLVGESGCGKSTLARMIVGLLPLSQGSILFEDKLLYSNASEKKVHNPEKIQMVFQDPFSSLNPRKCIGKSIAEPLYLSKPELSKEELKAKTCEILSEVGLDPVYYNRFPHEFSGGQRQRIALARALITKPEIIVCDEPVSALDVSVQAQVLNLMRDFQEKLKLSYIFISHDLHVVAYMSDEIAIMYLGQIVEKSHKQNIFEQPAHPYTKALLDAAPNFSNHHRQFSGIKGEPPNPLNPPKGCAFRSRCEYAKSLCLEEAPRLEQNSSGHFVACHYPLNLNN